MNIVGVRRYVEMLKKRLGYSVFATPEVSNDKSIAEINEYGKCLIAARL